MAEIRPSNLEGGSNSRKEYNKAIWICVKAFYCRSTIKTKLGVQGGGEGERGGRGGDQRLILWPSLSSTCIFALISFIHPERCNWQSRYS